MQTATDHGLRSGGLPALPGGLSPAAARNELDGLDTQLGRLAGEAADLIIEHVEDIQTRGLVARNFAAMVAIALLQRGVAR